MRIEVDSDNSIREIKLRNSLKKFAKLWINERLYIVHLELFNLIASNFNYKQDQVLSFKVSLKYFQIKLLH